MHDPRQICIHACIGCYQTCLGAAMTHCLETGGEHLAPKHFRLMMSCAEICRTAAHLMLIQSEQAKAFCVQCADVCNACALDCEKLDGMEPCVEACRHCADACLAMVH